MTVWNFNYIAVLCLSVCICEASRANLDEITLSEKEAKEFLQPNLRQKRFVHGLTRGSEIRERMRQQMEFANEMIRIHQALSCRRRCWQPWSEWSQCSGKCNGGRKLKRRIRKPPPECTQYPCPGSDVFANKCDMDCGPGGTASNDQCVCQPGYFGDCCQKRVTCAKPRRPSNGHLEGNLRWPAYYDTVITYRCDKGHALIGDDQRKCLLNTTWSNQPPRCQQIECPSPAALPFGSLVNVKERYFYGDNIGYQCNYGFEIQGVYSRTCVLNKAGRGRWSAFQPECKAIFCGDPGTPGNGSRHGANFSYNANVTFECRRGFSLIGSSERTCLSSQRWSGQQPVCKEIVCPPIDKPRYGTVDASENNVDTLLHFRCDHGYELLGNVAMSCQPDGTWNGSVPTCQVVSCGDPERPMNGSKDDSGFSLDQVVHYKCFEGYILSGARQVTCLANRTWSAKAPSCTACPKDFYKDVNDEKCVRCPPNSHTLTDASATKRQCICRRGYAGSPGGPCTEITCPTLNAPAHGLILECGSKLGESCLFDCDSGYILSHGSSRRTCREPGYWDGEAPFCNACPKHTFKAAVGTCLPCPVNTHNPDIAGTKSDCVCNPGYNRLHGRDCTDIDECIENDGKGDCQDGCRNTEGAHECYCNIQGYILDEDRTSCRLERQCKNLTVSDAPDHGGLVCHWFLEENSQQCTVRCNPGYELPTRINAYETCGPATGFTWSFRRADPTAELFPCIEEFFPDYHFEGESAYFVQACQHLTEEQKDEVKREFAKRLTDEGLCIRRRTKVCDMRNVGIICGRTRRKRGTEEVEIDVMDIQFQIFAKKDEAKSKNCDRICRMMRLPQRLCGRYCLPAYKRFLRAAVVYARKQVVLLYKNQRHRTLFAAANQTFAPSAEPRVSNVQFDCEPGMILENAMCVPCPSGTWFDNAMNKCVLCPVGTYQPTHKQISCLPCPIGRWAPKEGASSCTVCPEGFYGENCNSSCPCYFGSCDPVSGACRCFSGWTGESCETDIDGCAVSECFQNVTCLDMPAPGTGFVCGLCPSGLEGDGIDCYQGTTVGPE